MANIVIRSEGTVTEMTVSGLKDSAALAVIREVLEGREIIEKEDSKTGKIALLFKAFDSAMSNTPCEPREEGSEPLDKVDRVNVHLGGKDVSEGQPEPQDLVQSTKESWNTWKIPNNCIIPSRGVGEYAPEIMISSKGQGEWKPRKTVVIGAEYDYTAQCEVTCPNCSSNYIRPIKTGQSLVMCKDCKTPLVAKKREYVTDKGLYYADDVFNTSKEAAKYRKS